MLSILKKYMEAYMKKVILLAVLSSLFLSGCQSFLEHYRALHPEYVPAGPYGDPSKIKGCDEDCQKKWEQEKEEVFKTQAWRKYNRIPQPDDPYEYQVEINGKTVTCRPGLNTGSLDGINHNVICN